MIKNKRKSEFSIVLKNHLKNKKVIILSILVFVSILGAIIYTMSKYVIGVADTHIQRADTFYFNSSLLTVSNTEYEMNDWDTSEVYTITIDLKNHEDTLRNTNHDIPYTVTATSTSPKVSIAVSSASGILTSLETEDTVAVAISLNQGQTLQEGEQIPIQVIARSTSPYAKEIKAVFKLSRSNAKEFDAKLVNSESSSFAMLSVKVNENNVTKTITYDSTKVVLNTQETVLSNSSVTTNGNIKSISANLLANTNYTFEFIKKIDNETLVLGQDIIIN